MKTNSIIKLEKISVKINNNFKKNTILKNIFLNIPQNSVYGFIGPNGAGKTTTIKTILQQQKHFGGKINIFGKPANKLSLSKIGYAPDEPAFYDNLTGLEHITFFSKINQQKTEKSNSKNLLQIVGLEKFGNKKVKNYSRGMKQRLGIAISLINNPHILIRDEPMNGLDPIGRKLIKNIIQEQKKLGKTIFFSTHILNDVEELCDYFSIIKQGEIIFSDKTKNIKTNLESFFLKKIN